MFCMKYLMTTYEFETPEKVMTQWGNKMSLNGRVHSKIQENNGVSLHFADFSSRTFVESVIWHASLIRFLSKIYSFFWVCSGQTEH